MEHLQLHQQQGNGQVEYHPHHAAGVAVGQARKKVGPRQRAGIGVGDIDLQLRHQHKQRGGRDSERGVVKHMRKADQVHLVGVYRALGRHAVAQRQPRQQRAAQHFQHPGQHPAGAAHHHRQQPLPAVGRRARRHEAQVVCLLAHLGNQRNAHRERCTKQMQVKCLRCMVCTSVAPQPGQRLRLVPQHKNIRQHQQTQPQRLRPHL